KEEIGRAEALVKKLFKDDFQRAKEDAAVAKALAELLVREAKETGDDPALRYVALTQARDLAVDAGEPATVLAAIAELENHHAINAVHMRIAALLAVAPKTTSKENGMLVVDTALTLLDDALTQDNFAAARKLVDAADKAGQMIKNLQLYSRIDKRRQEVVHAEKEFARVKPFADTLAKDADNVEANREMGRYLCLTKGQWQRGLPTLAKGDDAKLKALAEKDLTKPKDAKMQVELADAWSELGESMKGTPNIHVMGRAFHWYGEALPKIEGGLTRLR